MFDSLADVTERLTAVDYLSDDAISTSVFLAAALGKSLRSLTGRARHAYWLNPEPRRQWDTGDSLATDYGAVIPMCECRNVVQLTAFIESIV